MTIQVLIVNPDTESVQILVNYFTEWGDQLLLAASSTEALTILEQTTPDLVIIDLHLPGENDQDVPAWLKKQLPDTKIIFTTNYPDPQQEVRIKETHESAVFLRQPFTRASIEQALRDLEGMQPLIEANDKFQGNLPKVRVPVRLKITLPYVLLALFLAVAAAYIISQVIFDTMEERFTNQLIEAGILTNDWMVNEEDQMLETLRLLSHTRELPEAVTARDSEKLRELALPVAINFQEEAVEILDVQGVSLLSLRHIAGGNIEEYSASKGESIFGQWDFVRAVLDQANDQNRDKFAGLTQGPWGTYVYVSGPLIDAEDNRVGVILVGKSLPTLVRQIRQDTLAHTTIYDFAGQPLASTFLDSEEQFTPLGPNIVTSVLERQNDSSLTRELTVASIDYSEILGPWQIREFRSPTTQTRTNNDIGLIGTALAESFLARPTQITRAQIFILATVAFVLIIFLGLYLANRITTPLLQVVSASSKVAQGNLEVQVEADGDDEVAILAHSFNHMVSGLREGSLYRDLFGRTVSPEIRDELRQGFASGVLRLEGQEAVATVLMSDIRGFTPLSETVAPATILNWLNEYFGEIVPVIVSNGGVVSRFEGDSVLAFFGILPRPVPPQESAYRACKTALTMLDTLNRLNARRQMRGDPPFKAGIGINTGPVTAGGLGSADRLHYTIIGDAVNATARLEGLTRQFGEESSAVISQHTLFALKELRHEFNFESRGVHTVKGKEEKLLVYALKPAKVAA